jgi:hypothetical protein
MGALIGPELLEATTLDEAALIETLVGGLVALCQREQRTVRLLLREVLAGGEHLAAVSAMRRSWCSIPSSEPPPCCAEARNAGRCGLHRPRCRNGGRCQARDGSSGVRPAATR